MVRKINLGNNFALNFLFVRKTVACVGKINPRTTVKILALNLHVGNRRVMITVEKVIDAQ